MILVNPEIDVSGKIKYNYMNIINPSISKNQYSIRNYGNTKFLK